MDIPTSTTMCHYVRIVGAIFLSGFKCAIIILSEDYSNDALNNVMKTSEKRKP